MLARDEPLGEEGHAALAKRFGGTMLSQQPKLDLLKGAAWVGLKEPPKFAASGDRAEPRFVTRRDEEVATQRAILVQTGPPSA